MCLWIKYNSVVYLSSEIKIKIKVQIKRRERKKKGKRLNTSRTELVRVPKRRPFFLREEVPEAKKTWRKNLISDRRRQLGPFIEFLYPT